MNLKKYSMMFLKKIGKTKISKKIILNSLKELLKTENITHVEKEVFKR